MSSPTESPDLLPAEQSAEPQQPAGPQSAELQSAEPQVTGSDVATSEAERPHWLRDIIVFLSAQSLSMFGSSVVGYAVIWFLALDTRDTWIFTLGMVAGMVPQGLLSIFGGVWADRHNRKLLIMGADGVIAVVTLVLAWFMLNGQASLWIILGVLALRSAGAGIQGPAVGALIPQLVPTKHLMRVNSVNSTVQSAIFLVAPAAAAGLIAWADVINVPANLGWIFLVDVTTATLGIGCMLFLKVATIRTAETADSSYLADLKAGLRLSFQNSILRRFLLIWSISFLLMVPPVNLATMMVIDIFGEEPWRLAALEIFWSGGMLVGGLVMAVWGGMRNRMAMVLIVCLACGVLTSGLGGTAVGELLLPGFGWFWIFLAASALFGFLIAFTNPPMMTAIQERVEPEMLGRIMGVFTLVAALGAPIGLLVIGPVANYVPMQWILIGCGAVSILLLLLLSIRAPVVGPLETSGDPAGTGGGRAVEEGGLGESGAGEGIGDRLGDGIG